LPPSPSLYEPRRNTHQSEAHQSRHPQHEERDASDAITTGATCLSLRGQYSTCDSLYSARHNESTALAAATTSSNAQDKTIEPSVMEKIASCRVAGKPIFETMFVTFSSHEYFERFVKAIHAAHSVWGHTHKRMALGTTPT
jgi:hypothetical protein